MVSPQVSGLFSLKLLVIQKVSDIGSLSWHGLQVKLNIDRPLHKIGAINAPAHLSAETEYR